MSDFMPWSLNVRCVQYWAVLQFYCDVSVLYFVVVSVRAVWLVESCPPLGHRLPYPWGRTEAVDVFVVLWLCLVCLILNVLRHQGEQCLCITEKQVNELLYTKKKKRVQCVYNLFSPAFPTMQFGYLHDVWQTVIDVRGRRIVLILFVGNLFICHEYYYHYFQVLCHINVWISWCLHNFHIFNKMHWPPWCKLKLLWSTALHLLDFISK